MDVHNKEFDRYSGVTSSYIDPKLVNEDLHAIEDKVGKINNFATKRVAHYNKDVFEDFSTFGELDESLNILEKVIKRYSLILKAESGPQVPTYLYDWKKIFRYPWIENLDKLNDENLGPGAGAALPPAPSGGAPGVARSVGDID